MQPRRYGDGSIVVVPAPGHTPGGVIIFVTLHNGTRYAFVGDIVWQLEGITLREERPWISQKLADSDAEGNRENLGSAEGAGLVRGKGKRGGKI